MSATKPKKSHPWRAWGGTANQVRAAERKRKQILPGYQQVLRK